MPRKKTSQSGGGPATLGVILGDQLDAGYPDTLGLDKRRDVVLMMEVKAASTEPISHLHRTAVFLSAMRHHAEALRDAGWRVRYIRLTDDQNTHTFKGELARAIDDLDSGRVTCIEPGSFGVREQLESACGDAGVELCIEPDPHFTCTLEQFNDWADDGRKSLVMEYFYREQRKRLGILMDDDGGPEGGSWNYDKQNRGAFKDSPDAPDPPAFKPDAVTRQVFRDVQRVLPELYGTTEGFRWPVTREQALKALKDFIGHRLSRFGNYQDAMWHGEHTLYHSLLSVPLNLKLLNPREVVAAAVRAYEDGDAPLNAVEGFVRQVIGWREFIRGVYFHEGPGYADRNELKQGGNLPGFYWDGDTDMRCMRDALGGVLSTAYGHHIARLMVTGNFALIAGVDPSAVNAWYLGMYADAVEWVTTPNTVGMVMHADGGVVGTKPYAASGKYIDRMSNYCADCKYNVKQRVGERACPFNTFYWDFLIRNESRLKKNHRMRMILKHVEKMDKQERAEITRQAGALRVKMGISTAATD